MACWRPWPGFMGAKLARSILQRRFLRYQVQLYCKLEKANNNLFLAGINQVCIEYVFVRRFSGPLESMDKSWLCLWLGSEKQPGWESSISHVSRSNGQKSRWDSNTGNNAMITFFKESPFSLWGASYWTTFLHAISIYWSKRQSFIFIWKEFNSNRHYRNFHWLLSCKNRPLSKNNFKHLVRKLKRQSRGVRRGGTARTSEGRK